MEGIAYLASGLREAYETWSEGSNFSRSVMATSGGCTGAAPVITNACFSDRSRDPCRDIGRFDA